jgi:uncharacterized protein YaiI (UPF0178 family)
MTLVANKLLRTPPSPYIRALQVPRGIDVADSHIVRELKPGDLVITADIPLAADVIAKGGHALNPRTASASRTSSTGSSRASPKSRAGTQTLTFAKRGRAQSRRSRAPIVCCCAVTSNDRGSRPAAKHQKEPK